MKRKPRSKKAKPALTIPEALAAKLDQAERVAGDARALAEALRLDPVELEEYLNSAGLAADPDAQRLLAAAIEAAQSTRGPRRLVVCVDGAWTGALATVEGSPAPVPTNVVKLAQAIAPQAADGRIQIVYFHSGAVSWVEQLGAFGTSGLDRAILECYRFLVDNYLPGDELFFFGFSRGAYIVRSVVGMLRAGGLLRHEQQDRVTQAFTIYRSRTHASHPGGPELRSFREQFSHEVTIRCLGVWETVGALGVPGLLRSPLLRRRHGFHDVQLPGNVQNAFQALAIDERRRAFFPCLWDVMRVPEEQRIEQVWFAGSHGDVGGGYESSALSDVALQWMVDRAASCGLDFDREKTASISGNPLGALHDSTPAWWRRQRRHIGGPTQFVHPSVCYRMQALPDYAPSNLLQHLRAEDLAQAGGAGIPVT